MRDYGVGAQILAELGVHDMILLTNSHHTPVALGGYGLAIVGERPIRAGGLSMAKILIVEARFYAHLNDLLLEGARAVDRGGRPRPRDDHRARRARSARRDRAGGRERRYDALRRAWAW